MKRCPRCGQMLLEAEFPKDRSRKDGLSVYCRLCCKERNMKYIDAGLERRSVRMRTDPEYRSRILEYHRAYNKEYRKRMKGDPSTKQE